MKAIILYYSTTGNSKYVGMQIAEELKKFDVSAQFFDGIEIIKALGLGRKDGKIIVPSVIPSILSELREAVKNSDIFGVGTLAYYYSSGPGFNDIFSNDVIPQNLFLNVKYIFGYVTWGGLVGDTLNIILTTLQSKCQTAKYIGGFDTKVPDNYAFYLPPKPCRDEWDTKEIQRTKEFGIMLGNRIIGKDLSVPSPFKAIPFAYTDGQKGSSARLGDIYIDNNSCVKCGDCVKSCPYSAVTISADVNEGYPVFDGALCWGCCRCFNLCSKDAINYKNLVGSETRMRHPAPMLDPETWGTPVNPTEKGMKVILQPLPDLDTMLARTGGPVKL